MISVLLIGTATFLFDQITKILIQKYFLFGESIPVIEGIFHITVTHNKGAAFGFFKNQTLALIIISVAALALFPFIYRISGKNNKMVGVCLGLIAGGACGNLMDRLRFGYVFDFLDFRIWPVFNVADAAITIGAVMLAICLIKRKQ